MAEAPAGGAGAKLDPQAAIAKHAAITQSGAGGDAAIISRIENAIKNSPMGWLQQQLGEVDSRAASEKGEVGGKVQEHQQLVASNAKDQPKDAGPPPALGPATHPAVAHPGSAGDKGAAPAAHPAPAAGATAAHPTHPVSAPPKSAPAAAPTAPAPTIAASIAGAGGDSQLDAILNAYTPKGQQSTQMVGRIKQMGDIAQGFNGQLDVYVAQGGAVEHGIAAASNFFGMGKDVSAVWANNPYRKVHGVLGGIMTGLSAVKNVCSVVGNICGKLGLVLTVIGLLGMIFPPIGAAVSGIARILNVVGVICDAVSFVLSGILTGLNGVVLAQQINAGASAEEKAATADLMMSEANETASGFVNLAMMFGPKFMKGMLGNSKGIIGSLMRRAKATIGRISLKLTADVKHFANRITRRLGFGGASMSRVGGAWKDTGFFARTKERFAQSSTGKTFYGAPKHLEAVQEKLMAKYGNTGWAKKLDRMGAWSGSVASKFDLEEKVGKLGEKSGKFVGGIGADTKFGKSMAAAADRSERQTRELSMKMDARSAADLEKSRWHGYLDKRQSDNPEHLRDKKTEKDFIHGQGEKVKDEHRAAFEKTEQQRDAKERLEGLRDERFERKNKEYYANEHGERDQIMDTVHSRREQRYQLEGQFASQETERKKLLGKTTKTAEDQTRLTQLNGELRGLDEARRQNRMYETELQGLAGGGPRVRTPEYKNWGDVATNVADAAEPLAEMLHLKEEDRAWAAAEKASVKKQARYSKGSAQGNAAGRGGHGTFEEIASEGRHEQMADFTQFVRSNQQASTVTSKTRGMLSGVLGAKAPEPKPAAAPAAPTADAAVATPAPSPAVTAPVTATPAAPAHAPQGGVAVGPGAAHAPGAGASGANDNTVALAASVHEEPPVAAPPAGPQAAAGGAGADDNAAEVLPYWPALVPEFDKASHDFDWMRRVAVEFKKAQIDGKQKAVDTLAVYGRYQEYAKLRADAAAKNKEGAGQTGTAIQQNVDHAGQTQAQAGQGEAKQNEAKGAASNKAATDLPEPESRGFWGRILGAVKRWAKNKAAQVFGWIQEKISSLILKGLCGVSMGDMREYAGALRRQQASAHGVADGAGKTSAQAQQSQIKLSADATKEAQGAADAIGECDRNITDADSFMGDIASFEQQLAEEKAHAQAFIAQIHAATHAEQARQQQEQAAQAQEEQKHKQMSAGAQEHEHAPAAAPAAEPTPTPVAAAAGAPHEEPHHEDKHADADAAANGEIHAAAGYVGTEGEAMVSRVEARADDYQNQLAIALTNHTGKDKSGTDLKGPSKTESKHIVEEFKEFTTATKHTMDGFTSMSIDPSQARHIADTIVQSAEQLEHNFGHSQAALDELFERTYNGIREGKRTLKSQLLDGDNAVGHINHMGDKVTNQVIDTTLPAANNAWNTVAAPIQVAPAAAPAAAPAKAPPAAPMIGPDLSAAPPPPAANAVAVARSSAPAPTPERVPDAVSATLSRAQGEPLPQPEMWSKRVGANVSNARIVTGEGAAEAAASIGARAFTVGNRVFFAHGNDAQTDGGNLLAHELTHVAQQDGGAPPADWKQTPFVDYHDQREVTARAQEGAPQTHNNEHAIARDAEPDINSDTYRGRFATQIGDGIIDYLSKHDLPTGSRFLSFLGPLLPGPALVGSGGAALNVKLDAWVTKEKVLKAIDHARPKGTVEVTDGKTTWVDDKINEGPSRWFPDVATELGAAVHVSLRQSLDRIVPRYISAAVAVGIAAEEKLKQNLVEIPKPKRSDIIASAPIDLATIDGLIASGHFDFQGYRAAFPNEKGKLGELRHVALKIENPKDGLFYARISAPLDATVEEVANALYGEPTKSGELKIVAPPLFGFTDGSKLKPEHQQTLKAMGVDLNVQVFDWVSAAAKGPLSDEIAKNQGKLQTSKLITKSAVIAAVDESLAIIPTIEKSGAAFGMGKNPVVSSLAPLKKELSDRRGKLATMNEEDALSWAGQTEGQENILTQVSFSFGRHASRLSDLTKMVTDAHIKLGGFNLPDHVREAMLVVAMRYADVALMSKMPETAKIKLAEVEDEAGALPVAFLEGTLASIQRSLDDARKTKHDSAEHASYDVGGMQNREQELKTRLVAIRAQIKADPEAATKELAEVAKLIQSLQVETELVANMDHIDAAWKALDDGVSFWWSSLLTQMHAKHLKEQGDKLHARWKGIFAAWKSGDPKKQDQAKKDLESLRTDGELSKWLGEIQSVLKDARIERIIGEFVVVIAITIVTAGVGDLVAAGAAGWELSAGTTAVLVGGAEAATFTALNQIFLDSDHSFGHVVYDFTTNWAMFGVMRRFQMFAEVAKLSKVASVTGSTLIMAASTYAKADLDKYIKEGRHLNSDEIKSIALQGMAMAIAMHAIAPAMKPMFGELEGSAYKFTSELKANNRMRDTLAVKAETLKGTRDYGSAVDYVTRERQWLEQRIKILDDIEAIAKAEEQPGAKKPADGGIAAKIKMSAADLGALRTDLKGKLAQVTEGSLPLVNLEPKGDGLFTCPREHITEVIKGLGDVTAKHTDPVSTITTYDVKLADGTQIKVMEKIDPAADWVAHLKSELPADALQRLEHDTKGMKPQQIVDHFHGDVEVAKERLAVKDGDTKATDKDTLDLFGNGPAPADRNSRWTWKDDPAHWTPARQKLHNELIAKAKQDALAFADAAPKGEPTLYAMRGNTAAGKTRAVANNVPELASTMKTTSGNNFRAVNPDAFKPALMTADGQSLTSSQVHAESSMLADRMQRELLDMKTSDGHVASILIDKRLATVGDVAGYAEIAKSTGRKFVLYDVDAPLEASLAGVLERAPGGSDPLPPYNIVADGFKAIHQNRAAVVTLFTGDPTLGTYEIFGTRTTGERVPAATIKDGKIAIHDTDLYKAAIAGPEDIPEIVGKQRITEPTIEAFTKDVADAKRRTLVQNLLRKYLGWTWRDALNAHSKERGAPTPDGKPKPVFNDPD